MILMLDCLDPVFYCNDLGNEPKEGIRPAGFAPSNRLSIKEAVMFAGSNNLMGIICSSRLLVCSLSGTQI